MPFSDRWLLAARIYTHDTPSVSSGTPQGPLSLNVSRLWSRPISAFVSHHVRVHDSTSPASGRGTCTNVSLYWSVPFFRSPFKGVLRSNSCTKPLFDVRKHAAVTAGAASGETGVRAPWSLPENLQLAWHPRPNRPSTGKPWLPR